jgi:hypothetical protein
MRTSENVFGMLQDRGTRGVPVDDLYRQLYNPHLYLRAYGRIYANDGAMTRGSTEETADAMSLAKIRKIIEDLRHERYRWTPVRRTFVPKKNGKMRALQRCPEGLIYATLATTLVPPACNNPCKKTCLNKRHEVR